MANLVTMSEWLPGVDTLTFVAIMAVKASALFAVAWFICAMLRAVNVRAKAQIWSLAFLGVFAMPLLALTVPSWELAMLPRFAEDVAVSPTREATTAIETAMESPLSLFVANDSDVGQAQTTRTPPLSAGGFPVVAPPIMIFALLMLWLGGAVVGVALIGLGHFRARLLVIRSCPPRDASWQRLCLRLAESLQITRPIELLTCDGVAVPMTSGLFRPVILLPGEADSWSLERRRIVLMHELMHIQRNDWLIQMMAQITCALHWFNPLAWLAARHLHLAREQACDAGVVARGTKPSTYADHLMQIALRLTSGGAEPVTTLAMVRRSQLEGRIMAILDGVESRRRGMAHIAAVTISLAALIISAVAAGPSGNRTYRTSEAEPSDAQPQSAYLEPDTLPSYAETATEPTYEGVESYAWAGPGVEQVGTETYPEIAFHGTSEHRGHTFRGSLHSRRNADGETVIDRIGFLDGDYVVEKTDEDGFHFSLRAHGEVEFSDDATEITKMDPDAWLVLETHQGETWRYLKMTSGSEGRLRYTYSIDGQLTSFDRDAQRWMTALLDVIADIAEQVRIRSEVNALRGKINVIHGERNALQGRINAVHGRRNQLRGRINALHGARNAKYARINGLRAQRNTLQTRINSQHAQFNTLRARRSGLRVQLERVRAGLRKSPDDPGLADQLDRVGRDMQSFDDEIDAFDLDARTLEYERAVDDLDIDDRVRAVEAEIAELETGSRAQEIEQEIESLDVAGRVADYEQEIEGLELERRVGDLENQIDQLRADERVEEIDDRLEPKYKRLKTLAR